MGFSTYPRHTTDSLNFQPYQIVCLQHDNRLLYAEVIQTIEPRKTCWVRPLALKQVSIAESTLDLNALSWDAQVYDLRQGSDLLLPISLFRLAMDTEVLEVLDQLHELPVISDAAIAAQAIHRQLNQLVQEICQAYPTAFQQ